MTITNAEVKHEKHAKLVRPALGEFGRNEIAFLGAPCGVIRTLFERLNRLLPELKIAFADADHQAANTREDKPVSLEFTDRISSRRLDYQQHFNAFQNRMLFNEQDLILVNGNHFKAQCQAVLIDPAKSLENKLDRLTDVRLVILKDSQTEIPAYLEAHLPPQLPHLTVDQTEAIAQQLRLIIAANKPPLYGLVLAGGNSQRMQTDKGSISYHGKSQRTYVYAQLNRLCDQVFISARYEQQTEDELPVIADRFLGLGPYGGILSAMQTSPDAAWLTVACDLPYLTDYTLRYLTAHRNTSKIATAFLDSDGRFPEPLITIWEPRAYPILLQFLAQGYSCPRKVLINSTIELLNAPDASDFRNVNHPEEREEAMRHFNKD